MESIELSLKRGRRLDCRTWVARAAVGLALLGASGIARGQDEIVGWGAQVFNSSWNDQPFAAVAAGGEYTVSLESDGSVVAWGDNGSGQCNVPPLPAGLSYVEVDAGYWHTVARRSDGSVDAWGNNSSFQCNVPPLPAGLSYAEVAAGFSHTVARLSDGSVDAWGDNDYGQCNVPALAAGLSYVEVAGGYVPHGGTAQRWLGRRLG